MTVVAIEIDAQCSFSELCPEELPVAGALSIVSELNFQASLSDYRICCKEAHSPRAHWVTTDDSQNGRSFTHAQGIATYWKLHCVPGMLGFESLPGLPSIQAYDLIIYKGLEDDLHPMGACYHDVQGKISSGLIEWLQVKKASLLIVGGLVIEYCVGETVQQLLAADKNWTIVLYLPACKGMDQNRTQQALELLEKQGVILAQDQLHLKNIIQSVSSKFN